jgi:DNA-binding transcriptional LysR family regulator
MDDRDWLILKILYEKKNITKTAQSLYMSQPALTKRIQYIENEFQVMMVERGTRGVQFTPQGEYIAKCADDMLNRIREIKETALNMDKEVVGTLRIGVSNFISKHKLPRLLRLFRERFPRVDFKVTTGWSREVFHLLYNQEVHIGIVRGDYQWAESKLLLFEENICVTSKEEIHLSDLPFLPRIEYETDTLLKPIMDNWWSGTFSRPPFIGMEVDKGDTCREMVMNGLGYGILPSVLVENDQELYRINLTDSQGNPLIRKTWMFYHEKSLQIKLVQAFVEFVEKVDFKHDI